MPAPKANLDWLALTVEEPRDPELPICDPHHHPWDLQPTRVAARYLPDEILEDLGGGHHVVSSYTVLWNSFKRLTTGHSAEAKAKLFHDTAARVYRFVP